jgi:hypothetical protein
LIDALFFLTPPLRRAKMPNGIGLWVSRSLYLASRKEENMKLGKYLTELYWFQFCGKRNLPWRGEQSRGLMALQ